MRAYGSKYRDALAALYSWERPYKRLRRVTRWHFGDSRKARERRKNKVRETDT